NSSARSPIGNNDPLPPCSGNRQGHAPPGRVIRCWRPLARRMKRAPGTKFRSPASRFAAIVLGSASLVSALDSIAHANSDVIVLAAGSVSYVYGAAGDDSIDRLNSLAGGFNLKLVFALNSGT